MATVTLKGTPFQTENDLPAAGTSAPDFTLVKTDLSEVSLADFIGKKIVLNIFVSLDTGICADSVRRFNTEAAALGGDVVILNISMDLPFAHQRFCEANSIDKVINLSDFRYGSFGREYGVRAADGPFKGLLTRAIVVVDPQGKIAYTEQVPEIAQDPDFDSALQALKELR